MSILSMVINGSIVGLKFHKNTVFCKIHENMYVKYLLDISLVIVPGNTKYLLDMYLSCDSNASTQQ